jgi:flagellar hook assembly protein FlgD
LDDVYPNPFNPTVHFNFSLPSTAHVRIRIFPALGEEVASVVEGFLSAGRHEAEWNGVNSRGNVAASGVYFVLMTASAGQTYRQNAHKEFSGMRKMLFLR